MGCSIVNLYKIKYYIVYKNIAISDYLFICILLLMLIKFIIYGKNEITYYNNIK